MARSKKTLWIVVGIAALALLVGVLLKKQESAPLSNENGGETMSGELLVPKRKEPTEMGGSTSLTFETDRINEDAPTAPTAQTQEAAETEQAMDPVEAAFRYDLEGGVGDPPEAWKDDYSHWDSNSDWNMEIEKVGVYQPRPSVYWVNQPTEEDRQRESELLKEVMEAQINGILRRTSKKGYLRRVIDNGKKSLTPRRILPSVTT